MDINRCSLCPRACGVDRNIELGYCRVGNEIKLAKAYLHKWEEPCISGDNGSGTVFFSNCNLSCVFCQNYKISAEGFGKEITGERLTQIMLELQSKGAHNINLVSPTPYIIDIKESIIKAKGQGLVIPIIYNSSGYENPEALKMLQGLIDIYLPDIKYFDNKNGLKYSKVSNYFMHTSGAIIEMYRQVGSPVFEKGLLIKGLMIRHMMLPGLLFDSKKIVDWVTCNLPSSVFLNIMCQYTPFNVSAYPGINKKVNTAHYEALIQYALNNGIENGFIQEYESAVPEYVPDFNLEGVPENFNNILKR